MLDFLLVLGQIPGTQFQITFYELAVVVWLGLAWLFRRQLLYYAVLKIKKIKDCLTRRMWQRRQLSLPV